MGLSSSAGKSGELDTGAVLLFLGESIAARRVYWLCFPYTDVLLWVCIVFKAAGSFFRQTERFGQYSSYNTGLSEPLYAMRSKLAVQTIKCDDTRSRAMKILAFVDVHANELVLRELGRKAREADLLICAGDISVFGRGLEETLRTMDSWGKPILAIHGNHEDEDEMRELVEATKNIKWAHAKEHLVAGLSIIGWGGGGFAHTDAKLEAFAKNFEPRAGRILFFHGPPYETAIDVAWAGEHVGCATRRAVIEKLQPMVALAGHIHECFGEHSNLGNSLVLNPGPLGVLLELKAEKNEDASSASQRAPPKKNAAAKKTRGTKK